MSSPNAHPERPLAEQVEIAMNATSAATEQVHLYAGASRASIRLQGGFLTRAVLESPDGPDSVLYCGSDLSAPKPPASHAMMPVGPSDGLGGQHGFLRWVKHTPRMPDESRLREPGVASTLLDVPSPPGLDIGRMIKLTPTMLNTGLTVVNRGATTFRTSLGEHFYFEMPEGSAKDIRVDRGKGEVTLSKLIGAAKAQAIDDGEAQFWPGFEGLGIFRLPDNRLRRIAAIVIATSHGDRLSEKSLMVGMLLWRRPGMPFICLEPTIGYQEGNNQGIKLSPGSAAGLMTSISVSGDIWQ